MTEVGVLKRKIVLKRQARELIDEEISELRLKLVLVDFKERLEAKIDNGFDLGVSRKLDCIQFLLEG